VAGLFIRKQDGQRDTLAVFDLDPDRLCFSWFPHDNIAHYGRSPDRIAAGAQAFVQDIENLPGGWVLIGSDLGSEDLDLAGCTHGNGVREELAMFFEHSLTKRQRLVQQHIDALLCLGRK